MVYHTAVARKRSSHVGKRDLRAFRLPRESLDARIEDYFASLDSPIALSCYMLWKYKEHDQLVAKEVDPSHYVDGEAFRLDYCAVSYLSKYPFLDTTVDRKQAALNSFKTAELRCKDVNARLKKGFHDPKDAQHYSVLQIQRNLIDRVLGEFSVEEVFNMGSFGPGVTFALRGRDTSASRKYAEGREITSAAYALFGKAMQSYSPSWKAWSDPIFVEGNSVHTVPKNAKTDRTIAIEPALNSWLQLGIGRFVRQRLRSFGYDLNSDIQNRRFAKLGAKYGKLATIDFKDASNSISYELVRELLPPRWFIILDAVRSHNYCLDGVWSRSEMFSTMGNGFTFELESLIFVTAAIALAIYCDCSRAGISIFGDDLTCSTQIVPYLTDYISFLGFRMNKTKSFWSGEFRESCGDHWFGSFDCKPLLLRGRVSSLPQAFDYANRLLLLAHRFTSGNGLDRRFRSAWHRSIEQVPHEFRLWGPAEYGSSVLFSDKRPEEHGFGRHRHWDGWVFQHLAAKAVTMVHDSEGHFLAMLRKVEHAPYDWDVVSGRLRNCIFTSFGTVAALGNDIPLRGLVSFRVSKNGFSKQWYDFDRWY